MHLYVSFEELNNILFDDGMGHEAYDAYPFVLQWTTTGASRKALWHAGQVICAARSLRPGQISDLTAVAMYQASLTFWIYGNVAYTSDTCMFRSLESAAGLDGSSGSKVDQWIVSGEGEAAIRGMSKYPDNSGLISVSDPRQVILEIIRVIQSNHADTDTTPPVIEFLIRRLKEVMTNPLTLRACKAITNTE